MKKYLLFDNDDLMGEGIRPDEAYEMAERWLAERRAYNGAQISSRWVVDRSSGRARVVLAWDPKEVAAPCRVA